MCTEREAPVATQFVQVINPRDNITYSVFVVSVTVVHLRAQCVQHQLISGRGKAFRCALCPRECAIISLSVALRKLTQRALCLTLILLSRTSSSWSTLRVEVHQSSQFQRHAHCDLTGQYNRVERGHIFMNTCQPSLSKSKMLYTGH